MAEYKIVWVPESVLGRGEVVELSETSRIVNQYCSAGWVPTHVTPGTNGQTYAGLFVVLRRD